MEANGLMDGSMTLLICTGLLFGAQHVLTGPDHLAAVAPLSLRGRAAWKVGLFWGLGHGVAMWSLAAVVFALGAMLPLETLGPWSERLVGLSVIGLGLWAWFRPTPGRPTMSTHAHGDGHTHAPVDLRAALLIGLLHGFAGGTHMIGVLPGLPLESAAARIAYLVSFGLGSIATMAAFSALAGRWLGTPSRREFARRASAIVAIAVGVVWLVTA